MSRLAKAEAGATIKRREVSFLLARVFGPSQQVVGTLRIVRNQHNGTNDKNPQTNHRG